MSDDCPTAQTVEPSITAHPLLRIAAVLGLIFVFLLGIHALGKGFALLGGDLLDRFFAATTNPFVGLMVGIFATSIVQSSSLTTSLVVGLVAAPENALPLANAVPMVMGANFGTTVTNTIVALGHIHRKDEFRKAFEVSTCDDFFNFFAVLVLLPVEMLTGALRASATALAGLLSGAGGMTYESPLKWALKSAYGPLHSAVTSLTPLERAQGVILILLSAVMLFAALVMLVREMRSWMATRIEKLVIRAFQQPAALAIVFGTLATILVQSSSIVTSLLVPLAGAGLLSLHRAFPVVLGANVGTTITALMAAMAATGANASAGLAVALVHLLFNTAGILLIYPWARIREVPLRCSRKLAEVAIRSAGWAIFYVVILFYGAPALAAFLNHRLTKGPE